jgi:hypothetical protein
MQSEGENPSKTARLMSDSITLVKLRHLSRKTVKDVAMHITGDSSVWSDAIVKIGEVRGAWEARLSQCLCPVLSGCDVAGGLQSQGSLGVPTVPAVPVV